VGRNALYLPLRTAAQRPRTIDIVDWGQKNREENKFSSRAEVWGYDFERFSKSVIKRWALMPLFLLRCFFLCCFFLFSHRLFPPFNPQMR
jgi:hypothetical protein